MVLPRPGAAGSSGCTLSGEAQKWGLMPTTEIPVEWRNKPIREQHRLLAGLNDLDHDEEDEVTALEASTAAPSAETCSECGVPLPPARPGQVRFTCSPACGITRHARLKRERPASIGHAPVPLETAPLQPTAPEVVTSSEASVGALNGHPVADTLPPPSTAPDLEDQRECGNCRPRAPRRKQRRRRLRPRLFARAGMFAPGWVAPRGGRRCGHFVVAAGPSEPLNAKSGPAAMGA